jgi:hypothetical protein
MTLIRTSLTAAEEEVLKTLNPAERTEAVQRCKDKAEAYLRTARIIEAWSETSGTHRRS